VVGTFFSFTGGVMDEEDDGLELVDNYDEDNDYNSLTDEEE